VEKSTSGHRSAGIRSLLAAMSAFLVAACAASPASPPLSATLPENAPISLAVAGTPPPATGTELNQLTGLSETALRRLLGAPDFRRREASAQIWQYRSAECVLDLFLYRRAGAYRVAYAETHDRDVVRVSQSSCYAGLLSRRPRLRQSRL